MPPLWSSLATNTQAVCVSQGPHGIMGSLVLHLCFRQKKDTMSVFSDEPPKLAHCRIRPNPRQFHPARLIVWGGDGQHPPPHPPTWCGTSVWCTMIQQCIKPRRVSSQNSPRRMINLKLEDLCYGLLAMLQAEARQGTTTTTSRKVWNFDDLSSCWRNAVFCGRI
jgi:hypothetical protein